MYLQNFQLIRPKFETKQEDALEWIINAHIHARMKLEKWDKKSPEYLNFAEQVKENLFKLGLGEGKVQKRASQIYDFFHENWEEMQVYNVASKPEGYHLDKRMEVFSDEAMGIFAKMYPIETPLPSHLIHVTCTGYVAPSPAQKLVSLRSGGKNTIVTHAYHMGCYGAFPSIRMAMGHFSLEERETDIVHTEFCTLHLNPTMHSMEQLMVQSLFADGFIKYTLGSGDCEAPRLKVLSILEEMIEDTTSKMTWDCNPWGFGMSISKDIPILLCRNLEGYLERLMKRAKRDHWKDARFAIHPGGPKIIELIADKLELRDEQFRHSKEVLKNYGNMSSATLPHVWDRMLKDPTVKEGESIISLAFGPGLSLSGGLFEKKG